MTSLLRDALAHADSLRAIERATGVKCQGMMRFRRGEQLLHLDLADKLGAYLGIECRRTRRRKGSV